MEFTINQVFYEVKSGSLDNVMTSIEYAFQASQSFSGSTYYARYQNNVRLPAVDSSSFVAYASCSEAIVKGWVEQTYITQSSLPGTVTASLWASHTSSVSTQLAEELTEQTMPSIGYGKPWE